MDKRQKYELRQMENNKKMFAARIDKDVSEALRRVAKDKQMPIATLAECIFREYLAVLK